MVTFKLETISHTDAARILAEHDEAVTAGDIINRKRSQQAVRRYQADIIADRWFSETAETLKFETLDQHLHGKNLIDGQTRLEACRLSGRSLSVYIARGVARAAQSYLDGGTTRNLATKLQLSGEDSASQLSQALKLLSRWDEKERRLTGQTTTDQRSLALLEADPAIRKSLLKSRPIKEMKLLQVGVAAFLHRIFSKDDRELADQFIEVLASGESVSAGDQFHFLRQQLIKNKGVSGKKRLSANDIIAMSIRAWNAKRQDREVKLLRGAKLVSDIPALEAAPSDRDHEIDTRELPGDAIRP